MHFRELSQIYKQLLDCQDDLYEIIRNINQIKMIQIKKWAQNYLVFSPIFNSKIFGKPNQQQIMKINARLFSCYCLKMVKHSYYDANKVGQLINLYYGNKENYWTNYALEFVTRKQQNTYPQLQHAKVFKFRELLFKTFSKKILVGQFEQLSKLYFEMQAEQSITQLDNFTLDLSFFDLYQVAIFCEMRSEHCLKAIGSETLGLLLKKIEEPDNCNFFTIIIVLERLKDKIQSYPKLLILLNFLSLKANFKQIINDNKKYRNFLYQKSMEYMLWLMHLHQFGEFVYKFVRQNFVYSQYSQNSIDLMCRMLESLQIKKIMNTLSTYDILLLNEIVLRIQQIQCSTDFYKSVKKNLEFQKSIKDLQILIGIELQKRATIVQLAGLRKDKFPRGSQDDLLPILNRSLINFYSPLSKMFIKQQIQEIYHQQYFSILVDQQMSEVLIALSYKIDNRDLAKKLEQKSKRKKDNSKKVSLLRFLERLNVNAKGVDTDMQISNIYQLKGIKDRLQSLQIINRNQIVGLRDEDIKIMHILYKKLSKMPQQLRKQQISKDLSFLFKRFEL